MQQDRHDALPSGSLLHHVYRIERILGSGAFGITYLAEHIHLKSLCVIKEYLPAAAVRAGGRQVVPRSSSEQELFDEGLSGFFNEAKLLHGMRHLNIVEVNNLFEENGTAYFVMPYLGRQTLLDWIAEHPKPDAAALAKVFIPLLEGLKYIHAQNLLHRDIKPANILIAADGRPILIDFGSARFAAMGKSQQLTTIFTPGFAPPEQYRSNGQFTPALDIYSLSACMFQAITGELPEQAPARLENDTQIRLAKTSSYRRRYPEYWLQAVDKGLNLHARDRFQSAFEMQAALLPANPSASAAPPPAAPKTEYAAVRVETPPPAKRGCMGGCFGLMAKAVIVLGVLAGGAYYALNHVAWDKWFGGRAAEEGKPYYGRLNLTVAGKSAVFNGRIENGRANDSSGRATLSFADGTECVGSIINNKREGNVRCAYPKGSVYDGAWKNDRKFGWGRYTYRLNNGEYRYEGGFVNDKLSGKGKMVYPNGAVYEGEFANDDIKGKGRGAMTGMDIKAFAGQHGLSMGAALCQGTFSRTHADCTYRDGDVLIRYKGRHKNGLWEDSKAVLTLLEDGTQTLSYNGGFRQGRMLDEMPQDDGGDEAAESQAGEEQGIDNLF